MLPYWLDARIRRFTGSLVAKTLARTALSASDLTTMSLILTFGVVWLLASGIFFWAGCLILFASSFDALDGALARAKNEASRFGSFLDSTLDRYSESLIFLGFLLYYQRVSPGTKEILLIYITTVGSLLISYIRARAEGLGFNCRVGLLERPARIFMIVFGLMTGWMYPVLWILAVLTHMTAIHRFIYVWWQNHKENSVKRSIHLSGRGSSDK